MAMTGMRQLLAPAVLAVVIGTTSGCALLYAETTVTTDVGEVIGDPQGTAEPTLLEGSGAEPSITPGP